MKTGPNKKPGRSIYLFTLAATGLILTAVSGWQLYPEGISLPWLLLTGLAAVSANASLKIPGVDSRISVADTFVLTSIIFFGPAAGCLSAAVEAIAGSLHSV